MPAPYAMHAGLVKTFAGSRTGYGSANGIGEAATFQNPRSMWLDSVSGTLYTTGNIC